MKVQVLSSAFEKNKETSDLPYRKFKILDQEQNVFYTLSEQFDIRHTTYFLWVVDDRVWVYSGDLGTFFWENEPDTKEWQQHVYKRLHLVKSDYVMVEKLKLIESGSPSPHGPELGLGDEGVNLDILALNHPDTPFVSGEHLSLVRDGIISEDVKFS